MQDRTQDFINRVEMNRYKDEEEKTQTSTKPKATRNCSIASQFSSTAAATTTVISIAET